MEVREAEIDKVYLLLKDPNREVFSVGRIRELLTRFNPWHVAQIVREEAR